MDITPEQIEVLEFIITNTEHLENHQAAIGIAKQVIAEQTLGNLSKKQKKVYQDVINPLFHPYCEGVMGWGDQDSCDGNGKVDFESLLESYEDDTMLCEICRSRRHQLENMNDP